MAEITKATCKWSIYTDTSDRGTVYSTELKYEGDFVCRFPQGLQNRLSFYLNINNIPLTESNKEPISYACVEFDKKVKEIHSTLHRTIEVAEAKSKRDVELLGMKMAKSFL